MTMQAHRKRFRVRVVVHKNDAFTMLDVINEDGDRLHYPAIEIPRSTFPFHLRPVGSRFFLERRSDWYESQSDPEYAVIPFEVES
jgi:hypothetical protein